MKGILPKELKLSYGDPPYDIHVDVKAIGGDLLAVVTGGTRPHIGAVALAEPADARHPVTGALVDAAHETAAGCPVLTAAGHKDTALAEMFARGLCEHFGVCVCAAAGVHVDNAGRDEIALMVENAKALLSQVIASV